MCGIAGIFTLDGRKPDRQALKRMHDSMLHRGPDGSQVVLYPGMGIVHLRLAIIDLEGGSQPIHAAGQPADDPQAPQPGVVTNGEIYNYLELRQQISDWDWQTVSDAEVVLPLWQRYGLDFTRHLRGMYAIAVFDPAHGEAVLARDPMGIKPLYYAETAAGIVFASEAGALRSSGLVDFSLSASGMARVLDTQLMEGADTVFTGIRRLAPGELLHIRNGRIVSRRIDPLLETNMATVLPPPQPSGSMAAMLGQMESVLTESVELHLRSDVPYGLFYSGGVDSTVLLALMRRLEGTPPVAYTVSFDDQSAEEWLLHARQVAAQFDVQAVDIRYGQTQFWEQAGQAVAATDDPIADYAILPTWHLAREARRDLTVVLSGEGGDEGFAGYSRYRTASRTLFARPPRCRPGPALKAGVLRSEIATSLQDYLGMIDTHPVATDSRLNAALRRDLHGWLPDNLLLKLDRCLMAHGLEGRTPLLDRMVTGFGFQLPERLLIRGRHGKWLLKTWLELEVPASRPFAAKRGFTPPVGNWINAAADQLAPLIANQPLIDELAVPAAVEQVIRSGKDTMLSWRLLYLALWHQIHICKIDPNQPLDAILAARI